jgi:hypothetical protein
MNLTFELISENPLKIAVYKEKARIGTINQVGSHAFNAVGSYFNVTVSEVELAKSCFIPTELPKAVRDNQLQLPIA